MRRGLAWITTGITVSALAVALLFRPEPLPAVPPPIRLEGSVVTGPPPQSLVVVTPPTIWLGETTTSSTATSLPGDDSADSPDDSDTPETDSPDDSVDSPDD
jgi:hypothetical protein